MSGYKKIFLIILSVFTLIFAQWKENEIVIKVSNNADEKTLIQMLKSKYGDVVIKRAGNSRYYLVKFKANILSQNQPIDIPTLVNEVKTFPIIEHAEPNYILKAIAIPNDSLYNYQWALERIDAPLAWDFATGDNLTFVGVVDTGVDYLHPDLQENVWRNPNEVCNDGIDNDGNGYIDDCYGFNAITGSGSALDDNGHGTHVAGIIGAVGNNAQGVVGVNWKVSIVGCKFISSTGTGSLFDELTCLDYIKQLKLSGYNIVAVNASYGAYYYSSLEENAIAELGNLGILFIAAAGNNSNNNDTEPLNPCSLSARLTNVICVAATDENDNLASFSNYGVNTVQVAAPGVNILNTYNGGYDYLSGTSMATPHVTGLVALLKSYNPSLTLTDLKSAVFNSVDNLTSLQGFVATGGRINLYKAIQYVDNLTSSN